MLGSPGEKKVSQAERRSRTIRPASVLARAAFGLIEAASVLGLVCADGWQVGLVEHLPLAAVRGGVLGLELRDAMSVSVGIEYVERVCCGAHGGILVDHCRRLPLLSTGARART